MSDTYIRNHREHDIMLNVGDSTVSVPRGSQGPEGFAPGIAKIDDGLLAEGLKHPVIKAYFDEGWLSEARSSESAAGKSKASNTGK